MNISSADHPARIWKLWSTWRAGVLALLTATAMGLPAINTPPAVAQQTEDAVPETDNEQALATYADAANLQNNGELELAIEQWQKLLKNFPDDPLVPHAAHYMGVCYMQLPDPKYREAAAAFERALRAEKYALREESLYNRGRCLYAVGSRDPQQVEETSLKQAVETFRDLLRQFPRSSFADRALFYTGESYYSLDQPERAIRAYDALLNSRIAEKSAFRCDAMYAKGVALEDLRQYDRAVTTYREMLESCGDDPLAPFVRMRLAEALVLRRDFAAAEQLFAEIAAKGRSEDRPRALYRRAYALAQLDRGEQAAELYQQVIREYPDSSFAASAQMAAAQSLYRAGRLDAAAEQFEQVVEQRSDAAAATEAAHWLTVIALGRGEIERANQIARRQIERGVDGPYALTLRVDAAEAQSMLPGGQARALEEFEALLTPAEDDPVLLPRIRYNAAFSALQLGQTDKVERWVAIFRREHPDSPLLPDMRYLAAEAALLDGQVDRALEAYAELLEETPADNPQRPLWMLRAGSAAVAAGQPARAIELLKTGLPQFTVPAQRAEALLLIGSAHQTEGRGEAALDSYQRALEAAPQWNRAPEVLLRTAEVELAASDFDAAFAAWQRIVDNYSESPLADQARYRMAQVSAQQGDSARAVSLYDSLLEDPQAARLHPFALYGKGYAQLQAENYADAAETLGSFLDRYAEHPLRDDSLLARAMCQRRLDQSEAALADLQAFLELNPEGVNLGHGLYEMALLRREQGETAEASQLLERIIDRVPDYPDSDDVLFELALAQRELEQDAAAAARFAELAQRFPDSPHAAEANYYVGQIAYEAKEWQRAEQAYRDAVARADDADLLEKSLYRLGWSQYQQQQFERAAETFARQVAECPEGPLRIDAMMMVGESHFSRGEYQPALEAYRQARERILEVDGEGRRFTDRTEQQVRELVFLHGGQSAAQLDQWERALRWYDQLRERYPDSSYLSQVFYETGFAYQRLEKKEQAIKFFRETANNFRDESAARARFMLGEIYFAEDRPADAIKEFKLVMYGFGAERAPEEIRDWQAKSGFEAGRCAELLVQRNQGERRRQAITLAQRYYEYVIKNHAEHSLAKQAGDRLDVLKRL